MLLLRIKADAYTFGGIGRVGSMSGLGNGCRGGFGSGGGIFGIGGSDFGDCSGGGIWFCNWLFGREVVGWLVDGCGCGCCGCDGGSLGPRLAEEGSPILEVN